MENPTIKRINKKKIPSNLDFLKIPHHGSTNAVSMVEYFEHINVSSVTSYIRGTSKNPKKEVLDKYKKISSKVFSTYDTESENDNYGIVFTTFDILNEIVKTTLFGNAYEYA